ncbi:MAG: DinB family protein [Bacteroidota bacterium]
MLLQKSVQRVASQLCELLKELSCEEYRLPSAVLNGATIGQHVRHIAELFQCLLAGYETGIVNYDNRNRDPAIETNRIFAHELLLKIADNLELDNRSMMLHSVYDEAGGEVIAVETNFYREVVYNLEHTIHHMALIRIGVQNISGIQLEETFGVAPSTIQYRKACAQ